MTTTKAEYYQGMIEGVLDGFAHEGVSEISRTDVSPAVKALMSVIRKDPNPKAIPGPKMSSIMESWGNRNNYDFVDGAHPKLVKKNSGKFEVDSY